MVAWWMLVACGSVAEQDTAVADLDEGGACGEVRTHDVEIRVAVVDAASVPLAGVGVALEERLWAPDELGGGTTDADGLVVFTAAGVTDVEGCWGTALDYWLVLAADGRETIEETMNSNLYNAIADGSLVVDLRATPFVMAP